MVTGRDCLLSCFMGRPPARPPVGSVHGGWRWPLASVGGVPHERILGDPLHKSAGSHGVAHWGGASSGRAARSEILYSTAAWKQPESNPGGLGWSGEGSGRPGATGPLSPGPSLSQEHLVTHAQNPDPKPAILGLTGARLCPQWGQATREVRYSSFLQTREQQVACLQSHR